MFVGELAKASFLSPAIIEPAPVEDPEGKLTVAPNSKVQFPMLNTPDGAKFFMAFTDEAEYQKWQEKNQKFPFFSLTLDDYAAMILRRDPKGNICPALGMVVNPFGANIIVPREMLAGMMSAKAAPGQTGSPETEEIGNFCRRRYKERLYCVDIINTGKQFGRLPRVQIIWTPRMVFTQGKEFPV